VYIYLHSIAIESAADLSVDESLVIVGNSSVEITILGLGSGLLFLYDIKIIKRVTDYFVITRLIDWPK
jgi:hypothetical protein